jgi:hypothetical protein
MRKWPRVSQLERLRQVSDVPKAAAIRDCVANGQEPTRHARDTGRLPMRR